MSKPVSPVWLSCHKRLAWGLILDDDCELGVSITLHTSVIDVGGADKGDPVIDNKALKSLLVLTLEWM